MPPKKCIIIGIPPKDKYIPIVQIPDIVSRIEASFCFLVFINRRAKKEQNI